MYKLIDKTLSVCYNLDYLVIVPVKDKRLLEDFGNTFGNVLLFENTVEDTEFLISFLKKNMVRQLVFVDYYLEYDEIIGTLVEEHEIKFIFTKSLSELSDEFMLDDFTKICERVDRGEVEMLGFLDRYLYEVMRRRTSMAKYVMLDVTVDASKKIETNHARTIGLLGFGNNNFCSFYNELAGFSFLKQYTAKVYRPVDEAVNFAKNYGIKYEISKSLKKLVSGNVCNLDVNFSGGLATNFLKSMDEGIPCIVGNNSFLSDKYPVMNKHLVVKSDDDVNEIAEKVEEAINNKQIIMKEYRAFRLEYSTEAKRLAEEFLGLKIRLGDEDHYDKLLTVVVPVYNTGKYLARCLDSIIAAVVPDTEILIINDGSTDGSEKIIKEYVGRYPTLIRYIKQKNGGLGHVRNMALTEAKGKYFASIDSDDYIEPDFLRLAVPYLEKDVDIVVYDWMSIGKDGAFETVAFDEVFRGKKKIEGLLYTSIMPSTCNKIFKIELFRRGKVKYLEQKYEDLSANPLALLNASSIKYIHKAYYNYYLSDNSLMRSKINPREMVDAICYLDAGLRKFKDLDIIREFKYYTYAWRIEDYILNPLYELDGKTRVSDIDYIYEKAYKIIMQIFEDKYYEKMLQNLKSEKLRTFITDRNRAFKKKQLNEFIAQNKNRQKLTAGIIYYGD